MTQKRYVLTDGKGNYIRFDRDSHKYVPVCKFSHAMAWPTFEKAEGIRKKQLPKKLSSEYYTVFAEVSEDTPQGRIAPSPAPYAEAPKPEPVPEAPKPMTVTEQRRLEELVAQLRALIAELTSRRDELRLQQSEIDKEVSDIQHYIELGRLNACDGFLIYKRLREALQRRRDVRDYLQIVNFAAECGNSINMLDDRKYSPRVLKDLFEDGHPAKARH